MLARYKIGKKKIDIEVHMDQLEARNYVAIAFSDDRRMGHDLAFVCSPSWNYFLGVKVFWNQHLTSEFLPNNGNVANNQSHKFSAHKNGQFTCAFSLDKLVTIKIHSENRDFDLEKGHYLLFATGAIEGPRIMYHSARFASKAKFGNVSGNKIILE